MIPKNSSLRESHSRSQLNVTCSSSVAAGADFHSIAFTFRVAVRNSASMEGGVEETENQAKKRGWFHSMSAGKIVLSKSWKIFSIGSPCSGAVFGRLSASAPG